ncbi:MAG: hypothetical protein V8R91_04545 [Butyricimonas faecihominis]
MEEEYQLLLKAGLLLAVSQGDFAINLTVGFPFVPICCIEMKFET